MIPAIRPLQRRRVKTLRRCCNIGRRAHHEQTTSFRVSGNGGVALDLYWPELDGDLMGEPIEHLERFPLVSKDRLSSPWMRRRKTVRLSFGESTQHGYRRRAKEDIDK